jgi:hypothetical protein
VAQVGVTDDTVTLAGAANVEAVAAVRDKSSPGDGLDAVLTKTASTKGAATTTGAATQSFLIERNHGANDGPGKRC